MEIDDNTYLFSFKSLKYSLRNGDFNFVITAAFYNLTFILKFSLYSVVSLSFWLNYVIPGHLFTYH